MILEHKVDGTVEAVHRRVVEAAINPARCESVAISLGRTSSRLFEREIGEIETHQDLMEYQRDVARACCCRGVV